MMTRGKIASNFVCSVEQTRDALGLTQVQMAEKLGLSVSGYKKMIAGETAKIDLYLVCRMYELTGRLFLDFCEDNSDDQLQIMNNLHRLNPNQMRFINGIVEFELAFQDNPDEDASEDYIDMLTLTGNQEDGMIWDSFDIQKINAARYRKRYGSALHCALKINSSHLHPVYNLGDILLISMTSPRDGDSAIFINKEEGRAYLRRYRQTNPCILEPLNGYGTTFSVDWSDKRDIEKWIRFGKVLSKMR